MQYRIQGLIKDASVSKALDKALSDDGILSFDEVKSILVSTLDGDGIELQEYLDLQAILKNSRTIDYKSKMLVTDFINQHYRPIVVTHPTNSNKLTNNFSLSEFKCKDGTNVPSNLMDNVKELAKNLQVLRDVVKVSIKINSSYRTVSHNKKVGGASKSQHLKATAADIVVKKMSPPAVKKQIEQLIKEGKMKQGGMKAYNSFVHYDVRGYRARW